MLIAESILFVGVVYLSIGIVFAIAFATVGVNRIDSTARGSTFGFRFVIVPGAMALWPLLLLRWIKGEREAPTEENAHRRSSRRGNVR